jgi:hypothetical protein
MMDRRIRIWNVLHDGEITAVSRDEGDALTIFVSIPYLRRRLAPLGDSFVLTLTGLTRLECQNFDATSTTIRDQLEIGTPEILSTESESIPVTIATSMGRLILNFQRVSLALDTGQVIEYAALEKTCEEYWAEWEARAQSPRTQYPWSSRAWDDPADGSPRHTPDQRGQVASG